MHHEGILTEYAYNGFQMLGSLEKEFLVTCSLVAYILENLLASILKDPGSQWHSSARFGLYASEHKCLEAMKFVSSLRSCTARRSLEDHVLERDPPAWSMPWCLRAGNIVHNVSVLVHHPILLRVRSQDMLGLGKQGYNALKLVKSWRGPAALQKLSAFCEAALRQLLATKADDERRMDCLQRKLEKELHRQPKRIQGRQVYLSDLKAVWKERKQNMHPLTKPTKTVTKLSQQRMSKCLWSDAALQRQWKIGSGITTRGVVIGEARSSTSCLYSAMVVAPIWVTCSSRCPKLDEAPLVGSGHFGYCIVQHLPVLRAASSRHCRFDGPQ
eukprot:6492573-Amphidinium_carterae.1